MKKKSTYGSSIPFLNINLFRKMKLILLFVAISFFQLSAVESYAQNAKINLSLSDVTLEEAIKTIEANTQFVFFFSNSAVDMTKHVDLNVKNGNIKEVLNQILSSYKYRIEDNKIVLLGEVQQDGKIWGIVSDAFGPIAGANVVVKGTTNGTITDMDGRFSLDAPKGAKLQISYIGYITKELTVDTKTDYVIELVEDSQALEEVVVVGYGTEKKVNVIGSIAQIGSEKLENRSTPQLSNVLTGQMAGVTVIQRSGRPGNSGGEIRVRGVGSFGGESNKSDALVLIDGIPGKLNDVSSEDVESISVLKDASTAAIYGSRAANGVILVTTKTGKEGKVSVGYNGYVGFNTPTALPEFVDTWQYATLYNEAVGREAYTQEEIYASVAKQEPQLEKWELEVVGSDADQTCIAVICLKEDEEKLETALRSIGFARPARPVEEVPAAYAKKLKAQAAEHEGRAAATEEELKQCASAREDLKLLSDYYRLRAQKYEALGEILQSEKTCMITGFIPKRDAKGLEEKLNSRFELAVESSDVPEDEEAPVLLSNGTFAASAEA